MALVERDEQLTVLAGALTEAADGRGRIALVTAEAGGGKTALARHFAEHGGAARTLWGTCDDLITPLPFGPLLEIGRQIGPAAETALGSGERAAALTAILDCLEARPHPALLVIDDLQWADQATVDLLTVLGSQLARLPALVVLTLRPEETTGHSPVRSFLGRLPADLLVRLDLPPLTPAGIARLAGGRLDPQPLAALTGGNPLYVSEILESGESLPPSVLDSVLVRLAGLPDGTRALLDLIAIVPGRMETQLLDRLRPGWEEHAEAAEERRILTVGAREIAFRHELTRQAVEGEILMSRRRRLHAEVLEALSGMDAPAGRLVHHAAGAGDVDALLRHGPVAAREASRAGAHVQSADHLRRVLEHGDHLDPDHRAELHEDYWLETWTIGHREQAEASARSALAIRQALGQTSAAVRDMRMIARVRWYLGDSDEAERLLDEAIEAMDALEDPDPEELAMTLAYRASLAGIRWSASAAMSWSDRALSLLDHLDGTPRALVLTDIGTIEYLHGDRDSSRLEEAIAVSRQVGQHVNVVRTQVNLAAGALLRRDYEDAGHWLTRADDFAAEHQVSTMRGPADALRAQLAFETGDWTTAEQTATEVVRDPDHAGFSRLPALITLAQVQVRRGDVDATESLDEAWEHATSTDEAQRLAPAAGAVGEHAWLLGRPDEAVDRLRTAHRRAVESGVPRWIGETAFWLHRTGALEDPVVTVEEPYRLMLEGDFAAAAEAWNELGCPYEAALAGYLTDVAETILGTLETLDRLEASPLARKARARLHELGVERVPRGPRRTTRENPAGLTARQMDVLRLIPEGHTNAEIADRLYLSTRTVDHHVAAILMKLGVPSRQEAARSARELGILE